MFRVLLSTPIVCYVYRLDLHIGNLVITKLLNVDQTWREFVDPALKYNQKYKHIFNFNISHDHNNHRNRKIQTVKTDS